MKKYVEHEKAKNAALIKHSDLFDHAHGGGFNNNDGPYPHILIEPKYNLYSGIRNDSGLDDFSWWRGEQTGNTVSSQISCVNHLYSIADNPDAVLAVIKNLNRYFDKVLPLTDGKKPKYVSFEVVDDVDNKLEEAGSMKTQIDAVILAQKRGKTILIIFEWKFTEQYESDDMATQSRTQTYSKFITNRSNLIPSSDMYYTGSFYQLMRQTLWAENIGEYKGYKIDDYLHVMVVPSENEDLRRPAALKGKNLETKWQECLKDRKKFKIKDPVDMFRSLAENPQELGVDPDLIEYLRLRYW